MSGRRASGTFRGSAATSAWGSPTLRRRMAAVPQRIRSLWLRSRASCFPASECPSQSPSAIHSGGSLRGRPRCRSGTWTSRCPRTRPRLRARRPGSLGCASPVARRPGLSTGPPRGIRTTPKRFTQSICKARSGPSFTTQQNSVEAVRRFHPGDTRALYPFHRLPEDPGPIPSHLYQYFPALFPSSPSLPSGPHKSAHGSPSTRPCAAPGLYLRPARSRTSSPPRYPQHPLRHRRPYPRWAAGRARTCSACRCAPENGRPRHPPPFRRSWQRLRLWTTRPSRGALQGAATKPRSPVPTRACSLHVSRFGRRAHARATRRSARWRPHSAACGYHAPATRSSRRGGPACAPAVLV
jgi:hypothetical protein